jgi:hypothetical protein
MGYNIITPQEALEYPIQTPVLGTVQVQLNFIESLNGSYVYYKASDTGFHNDHERAYVLNKGKVMIENGKAILTLYPIGVYKQPWNNYNYSKKHIHYRIIYKDNSLSEVFTIFV